MTAARRILMIASLTTVLASCGVLPLPGQRWQVDAINGPDPVIVSITTDAASWAWQVAPNQRVVLLDLDRAPTGGTITLIRPGADCEVLDEFSLPETSFTIMDRPGDATSFSIERGASLTGAASTDYEGGCSG